MKRAVFMRTHWTEKLMVLEMTLMPVTWPQVHSKFSRLPRGAQWVC